MSWKEYIIKKKQEEKQLEEEARQIRKKEKELNAKSRVRFKEFFNNIENIVNDASLTRSSLEVKYGTYGIEIFKENKWWISMWKSCGGLLGEETFHYFEYDLNTGKEIYHYRQNIPDLPFAWWATFKTNKEARLFIEYVAENIKLREKDKNLQ